MKTGVSIKSRKSPESSRQGAVAVLLAILAVPLMGMLAFSIDYGFLKNVEAELQRAADAGALAAVLELVPAPDGSQDPSRVADTVREYVSKNLTNSPAGDNTFVVLDADIEVGRYDESSINGTESVILYSDGILDTVRVTLRRDDSANGSVGLFFAPVLGVDTAPVIVTATAVLRRGVAIAPGSHVLPFALPDDWVNSIEPGTEFSIYNDNKILDADGNQVSVVDEEGNLVQGNWGTVDLGDEGNSLSDIARQVEDGLTQDDLDALYNDGRIDDPDTLVAPFFAQGDTGISLGIKDEIEAIQYETRIIPLYDAVNGTFPAGPDGGNGNNAEFHIVGWAVIQILDSNWIGNKETSITVQKAYTYDGGLVPLQDLTSKSSPIKNAFTSPVLVR